MNIEIVKKDIYKSRLTVTRTRCTLKIAPLHEAHEAALVEFSKQVYAGIDSDFTYRGHFMFNEDGTPRRIKMLLNSRTKPIVFEYPPNQTDNG